MRSETVIAGLLVAALLPACESKKPKEDAKTADKPAAIAAEKKESARPAADGGDWCATAHADTVKLVEGMKEAMARNKQEAEGDEYAVPDEATYVEACQKLPEEMQKCLVIEHAMQNKEACQKAQEALDAEQKKIYTELMGK